MKKDRCHFILVHNKMRNGMYDKFHEVWLPYKRQADHLLLW